MKLNRIFLAVMVTAMASLSLGQAGKDATRLTKQLDELDKQYYAALSKYYEPYSKAKTPEESAKIKLDPAKNPVKSFLPKYDALRKQAAKNPVLGLRIEGQIATLAFNSDDHKLIVRCLDTLSTKFVKVPGLTRYMYHFSQLPYLLPNGKNKGIAYLQKIEATSPLQEVKAAALMNIAEMIADDAKKARSIYEDVKAKYPKTAYAGQADSALYELDNLQVGMLAPDFETTDENGVAWKLSDYRGKVVVVTFWGFWCGPCKAMIPHEKEMVERLKDKPFAMLGMNSDRDKSTALKSLKEEGITWRQGMLGSITAPLPAKWNVRGWPTIYIIDEKGVIRYRNLRDKRMEDAVNSLLDKMSRS